MKIKMIGRTKAFTLAEILVVLILTSILTGLVYYAFLSISSQFAAFQKKQEDVIQISSIYNQFQVDYNKAETVFLNGRNLRLNYPGSSITYSIYDDKIVRKQGIVQDEIAVKVKSKRFYSQDRIVNSVDQLVDRIEINFDFRGRTMRWYCSKLYDSKSLIQHQ